MTIKQAPAEIWAEYRQLVLQNEAADFYETVEKNENFFIGRQWEGVAAPDLDKPVFNILKRVVSYFVSTIVSDDVAARVSLFSGAPDAATEHLLHVVSNEFDAILERCAVKSKNRDAVRNAAVDGDACFYIWFDPEQNAGPLASGQIEVELIDNTNVYFGNPQSSDVQKQPFLILAQRKTLAQAREEARQNGASPEETGKIEADSAMPGMPETAEDEKVTLLLKFWKQWETKTDAMGQKTRRETVYYTKVARGAVVKAPVSLGYSRYPIAYFSWDKVKNSCHGQSCVTGLIPNQIYINKLFAMCMEHTKKMAFPKIAYNAALLPGGWSNRVGEAIPVQGDPNQAFAANVGGADMSAQVMALIEKTIQYTRDTMGASDAALGNVRPDNTSAIIAVQKSSAMPLELQKMAFYQFVEDYIRIFLDMMRVDYGVRGVFCAEENKEARTELVDFSALDGLAVRLNVDVGASSYWSELVQVQTIDNLFGKGVIDDPVLYLEMLPDGVVPNKNRVISRLLEKRQKEA